MTVWNLFEEIATRLQAEGWTRDGDCVVLGDATVGYEPEESDLYPGIYLTFDNFISGHMEIPENPTVDDYISEIHIEVGRWEVAVCRSCGIEGTAAGGSVEVAPPAPGVGGLCPTCASEKSDGK